MPTAANRRNYRGKHRAAKSPANGAPRLFATLLAGSLLGPGALALTTTATAAAAAPSLGFKAPIQGYDSEGRAIIHYNNKINDPDVEAGVKHLNSTPGLNIVLKPGSGRGAINITRAQLDPGVAGLGGMDATGPFVKIDANNRSLNSGDRTEVVAHELLHSIGLDHSQGGGCDIMAPVINRCNSGATPLNKGEIDQLNSMYKKGKPSSSPNQNTSANNPNQSSGPGDQQSGPKQPNRPGQDGGDDSGQDSGGDDSGQDSGDSPGQSQEDGGDDWFSQNGQDSGEDESGQDSGDWFSQNGQDSGDDWFSQNGQDSGDDWFSQNGQDSGDDWMSQFQQDSGNDWFGQDSGDDWSSRAGDGFDWFGDGGAQDISGDLFGGGDSGGDMFGGDLFGGGGDGFDWFGGGGGGGRDPFGGGFDSGGFF